MKDAREIPDLYGEARYVFPSSLDLAREFEHGTEESIGQSYEACYTGGDRKRICHRLGEWHFQALFVRDRIEDSAGERLMALSETSSQ